jgi:membrane-associated phospholipid phosphatase
MKAKHDTTLYKGHLGLYRAGFVVSLVVFVVATLLAISGRPTGWEYTWFTSINSWPHGIEEFMETTTALGSIWAAAAAVVIAFSVRFYRLAWRMALSTVAVAGIVLVCKHLISRERPFDLFTVAHERIAETGMGYPSAHAAIITVLMLSLLPYMSVKWRWIVPVFIGVVGLSRVYLGVHLPLDIIGGIAVGTAVVAAVRIMPQNLRVLLRID